jgi:hypothetical protein
MHNARSDKNAFTNAAVAWAAHYSFVMFLNVETFE